MTEHLGSRNLISEIVELATTPTRHQWWRFRGSEKSHRVMEVERHGVLGAIRYTTACGHSFHAVDDNRPVDDPKPYRHPQCAVCLREGDQFLTIKTGAGKDD